MKYDFDAKKEFLEQQQEVKLLEERDRFRTIIVIVGLILIALIVVIGYYNIRQKNLQKQQIWQMERTYCFKQF